MAASAFLLLALLCPLASGSSEGLLARARRLRGGARSGLRVRAAVSSNASQLWFGDAATPEMDAAYLRARNRTFPELRPNVSDAVWYRDYYAWDVDNALMNLSFTSKATQPTEEQRRKEEAREQRALDKLMPIIRAEEAEAEDYYHNAYPYRAGNDLEDFVAAWGQISRMTYRKGFAPMYRCVRSASGPGPDDRKRYIRLTSDAGWGCMIRVGQMLLATALKHHVSLGGAPGSSPETGAARGGGGGATGGAGEESVASRAGGRSPEAASPALERQFLDDPCPKRSPFSIFGFVRAAHGKEVVVPPGEEEAAVLGAALPRDGVAPTRQLTQKLPGDWFGPTTISETIAALVERSSELREGLAVYVDADGILYEDEVRALAGVEEVATSSVPASPELVASSGAGKPKASTSGRCGGGDSDEEFMVLSTASVSGASATSPRNSTVPADMPQSLVSSPILASESGGEFEEARGAGADVLQVGSFQELQPGFELSSLQLPPPALGDGGGVCSPESPSRDDSAPTPARWRRAVLLLFPLQLGCEKYVAEAHVEALLSYFELRSSLGAMGGRPRMAHFFVGKQGRGLLYVDPHVVQPAAVSCSGGEAAEGSVGAETFHNTPTVQVIPVEQIDSSISLAFYCRSEAQLRELLEALRRVDASEADALIHVEKTRPFALRTPQANGLASVLWCDSDSLAASFTEVSRRDEQEREEGEVEEPGRGAGAEAAPSRPRCIVVGGGAVGDDGLLEFQRELEEEEESGGGGGGGIALGPSGRALCVGAPWADGPWAEVEEEGDVVIESGL